MAVSGSWRALRGRKERPLVGQSVFTQCTCWQQDEPARAGYTEGRRPRT